MVSDVAAQEITREKETKSHDYVPMNYLAVLDQLNRASQPTVWQRVSGWLSKERSDSSESERRFVVQGNVGLGYTQETNAMLAASVVGRYLLNHNNELPYSTTSLIGAASVNGFFRVASSNNLVFSSHDCLNIYLGVGSMPVNFWGLGYLAADRNRATKYVRNTFNADVEYIRRIIGGLSAGVGVDFRYASATDVQPLALEYLHQGGVSDLSANTIGLGLMARYDGRKSRDNQTRGVFLELCSTVHPKALGSHDTTLWHVEATANYYQPMWSGGELALDLYADMWSWNTPWLFWAKVGGGNRMRGYYYGRYTDRKMATAQIELRQKIYKALSGAAWVGAGSVFSSHKLFDVDEVLPNYGIGLRVALAGNLSFRIDYGFGRHSHGLIINVNEAF